MAQQSTAPPVEGRSVTPGAVPSEEVNHQQTARVSVLARDLPSWFWGAMGCLSVLAVGMTVLFLIVNSSGERAASGAGPLPPTAVAGAAPSNAAPRALGIQVEPIAAPRAEAAAVQPKRKPAPRVVKVARTGTPGAATEAAGSAGAENVDEDTEDADPEPTPPPKPKARVRAAAAADDGPAPARSDESE
jgi:hypothetical protein